MLQNERDQSNLNRTSVKTSTSSGRDGVQRARVGCKKGVEEPVEVDESPNEYKTIEEKQ